MRVIKNHEGERDLEGNGAAVCVGLGSALCQVVQGRCGGPSDLGYCGEGRDAGKRVACVGVAAWDVGHSQKRKFADVLWVGSLGIGDIFAIFVERRPFCETAPAVGL